MLVCSMRTSKLSTFALGHVTDGLNVGTMTILNCVIKALAGVARRLCSKTSHATVAELSSRPHSLVVPSHHRAASHVIDRKDAVIPKLFTIVTEMTRIAPSARF